MPRKGKTTNEVSHLVLVERGAREREREALRLADELATETLSTDWAWISLNDKAEKYLALRFLQGIQRLLSPIPNRKKPDPGKGSSNERTKII